MGMLGLISKCERLVCYDNLVEKEEGHRHEVRMRVFLFNVSDTQGIALNK